MNTAFHVITAAGSWLAVSSSTSCCRPGEAAAPSLHILQQPLCKDVVPVAKVVAGPRCPHGLVVQQGGILLREHSGDQGVLQGRQDSKPGADNTSLHVTRMWLEHKQAAADAACTTAARVASHAF